MNKYHFFCPSWQVLVKKTLLVMAAVLISSGFVQLIDMVGGYIQKAVL